jgi:uncharacterized protein (DUF4415 family)
MKKKATSPVSRTNWRRVDALTDDQVDLSDAPEITPEMFARAIVRQGLKLPSKTQLTLRLDDDVVTWFRQQGKGYQTRINAVLRAYKEAHQSQDI